MPFQFLHPWRDKTTKYIQVTQILSEYENLTGDLQTMSKVRNVYNLNFVRLSQEE